MICLLVSLPYVFASELNLIYDANGNLVSGDGFVREYNALNQLVRVTNESGSTLEEFIWHPTQERIFIKKVFDDAGAINQRIVYLTENTIKIVNSSGTYYENYVYQDGVLVAQVNARGEKEFIHTDMYESSTVITDITGGVLDESFFEPFGQELTGFSGSRYSFTGKERSEATGEMNFDSRMYNSMWGRFSKPDSLFYDLSESNVRRTAAYYDPQLINSYSYARNNPYRYIDIDGNFAVATIFVASALLGFGVGIATSYAYQKSEHGQVDYGRVLRSGIAGAIGGALLTLGALTSGGLSLGVVGATETATAGLGTEVAFNIVSSLIFERLEDVSEDEEEDDKLPFCEKCYTKYQVDSQGYPVVVVFNQFGKEIGRGRIGGGGGPTIIFERDKDGNVIGSRPVDGDDGDDGDDSDGRGYPPCNAPFCS